MSSRVLGVIPARLGSTRLPEKLLRDLLGKSILQRSWERASSSHLLNDLVIAVDHQRLYDHVISFGGKALLTSEAHLSGTSRAAEVASHHDYLDYESIVVIQGDEPLLPPDAIKEVVLGLDIASDAVCSTVVAPLTDHTLAFSPSVVKCVVDQHHYALLFTRAPVPHTQSGSWSPSSAVLQHIGLYSYRRDFLLRYIDLPTTPLMEIEKLEQMKILEHGCRIVARTIPHAFRGIDVLEDLKQAEELLSCE